MTPAFFGQTFHDVENTLHIAWIPDQPIRLLATFSSKGVLNGSVILSQDDAFAILKGMRSKQDVTVSSDSLVRLNVAHSVSEMSDAAPCATVALTSDDRIFHQVQIWEGDIEMLCMTLQLGMDASQLDALRRG